MVSTEAVAGFRVARLGDRWAVHIGLNELEFAVFVERFKGEELFVASVKCTLQ